jgi:hypothetical protein
MPVTTEIDIDVKNNTVIVGQNGGNVRGKSSDRFVWNSASSQFKLRFHPLGVEGAPAILELPDWPFDEEQPASGIVGPTKKFVGTLSDRNAPGGAYKYSISVGNLIVDPIIIVDKKT